MYFCLACLSSGRCLKKIALTVSDDELRNPKFLTDVRLSARKKNVSSHRWLDYLCSLYRDYDGTIFDHDGKEVLLDLEAFESVQIREWFRSWISAPDAGDKPPRLRSESRERVRLLATILRAAFPGEARLWGVEPANDN